MVEMPCSNRLYHELIPRCKLPLHRQECKFERVSCRYSDIGSEKFIFRKDVKEHERDIDQHLQLSIDTVQKQFAIVQQMRDTIEQ